MRIKINHGVCAQLVKGGRMGCWHPWNLGVDNGCHCGEELVAIAAGCMGGPKFVECGKHVSLDGVALCVARSVGCVTDDCHCCSVIGRRVLAAVDERVNLQVRQLMKMRMARGMWRSRVVRRRMKAETMEGQVGVKKMVVVTRSRWWD